jgi:hypothetical protein
MATSREERMTEYFADTNGSNGKMACFLMNSALGVIFSGTKECHPTGCT